MRSFTSAVVAVVVGATAIMGQGLPIINTPPSLIVCQPASISFSAGTAPYIISVLPGGQTTAAALETFPTQAAAGSYVWTVDLPAGTSVTLAIRDAQGQLNYAQQVTILAGTTTSCIGAAGSSAASVPASSASRASSSSAAAPASSASSAVSSSASSAAPTTTAAASSVSSRASSSASSAPASSSVAPTTASAVSSAPAATSAKAGAGSLQAYGANAFGLVAAVFVAIAA